LFALTLVAALYIGLQVVTQGVLGASLPGAPAPLVAAATAVFGPWGTRLLMATTLLSVAGFLSADVLCSPRNLAALAERRQLPRALAAVHARFKTPAIAIGVYALMCATVALSGSFRQLVIVSTSGTLVLYLICCLGLLRLRARGVATAGPPFRAPGGSLVPLAAPWRDNELAILQGVPHLMRDHRGGGDRERTGALRESDRAVGRAVRAELRPPGYRRADAKHLAPWVVVVGQLAGDRLDLHVGEPLPVEEPAGEIEG